VIKVGIVDGTDYTGAELMRLLVGHPGAKVISVTSQSDRDTPFTDVYPHLRGSVDLSFVAPNLDNLKDCDVVFFATSHGVAQSIVPAILVLGIKVIDLSADFRIRDVAIWERWYGQSHQATNVLSCAVYGLLEFNREKIKNANLLFETSDSFKAYAASGHRHQPEIEQSLADIAGVEVKLTLLPGLVP
jgi:N-acetyl-gamma-glutamyl-phosphate reductase